jgi:hypothetical protein
MEQRRYVEALVTIDTAEGGVTLPSTPMVRLAIKADMKIRCDKYAQDEEDDV